MSLQDDQVIKNKKTQYRLYDYTYIALWDSFRFSTHGIQTCMQV